ncbi:hypothetical protein C2E31_12675 [Rhodopirellula baltica]|nr:hypothetical protein C2E31_12675 [Rhodopirellula baltica]
MMRRLALDPTEFNRQAWDNIARSRNRWFTPAPAEQIARASSGDFTLRLTACKTIPMDWIGNVQGKRILALAAGGGHQGPILAAAGASVTVVDISEGQLEIDRRMADEHQLDLVTLQADMADLAGLDDASFDMVINPCSVNFAPDVRPIWQEAARVLCDHGVLIAGSSSR